MVDNFVYNTKKSLAIYSANVIASLHELNAKSTHSLWNNRTIVVGNFCKIYFQISSEWFCTGSMVASWNRSAKMFSSGHALITILFLQNSNKWLNRKDEIRHMIQCVQHIFRWIHILETYSSVVVFIYLIKFQIEKARP